MACRNKERAEAALERMRQELGTERDWDILFRQLDTSKMTSVRTFAQEIINTEERLDVLINNAGILGECTRLSH